MSKKLPIRKEILELLENPEWREEQRSNIENILYNSKEKITIDELSEAFKNLYAFVLLECSDIRSLQTTQNNRIIQLENPGLPKID
ncbi:MAG: hypothetical protein A2Z35_05055 [Actinobacteria bacterium RBG_19FT_COMBO_36_27]|nr:MAG: hypothetical protein A2Z35_05055 [Actinobacteria bacterium RBG_19FT_COMBO_36_27]